MNYIKLLMVWLLVQSSCWAMDKRPFKIFIPVAQDKFDCDELLNTHEARAWINENLENNKRDQFLLVCEIKNDLGISIAHQYIFMYNLDLISQSLAPSHFISRTNNYVINPAAIEQHIAFLNQCKFLESQLDCFTKQFLIKYSNIIFDKYGNYLGVNADNKNELLKLCNNYLRTFSFSEENHAKFLQQLKNQRNLNPDILAYNAKHGSWPLSISEERSSINKQFAKRLETINNNTQVKLLQEFIEHYKAGRFEKAETLIENFNNTNTISQCKARGEKYWQPLQTALKVYHRTAIAQESRFSSYLKSILYDYQVPNKARQPRQPWDSSELTKRYTQLQQVRRLKNPYQKNFAAGIERALSNDECALLYQEWLNRCYDAITQHQDSPLLELECNIATTAIQKKLEYECMQTILDFDQKIKNGETDFNYIEELSDIIKTWNAATAYPLKNEHYLEDFFKNLRQEGSSQNIITAIQEPLKNQLNSHTDTIATIDATQVGSSAQQIFENPTQLDIRSLDLMGFNHEQQLSNNAYKDFTSTISLIKPYNVDDPTDIRDANYQQRYDIAIDTFKKACEHIKEPHIRDTLFVTLMDTIAEEYFAAYKSLPLIIFEKLIHNFTHPIEFTKNYFIGLGKSLEFVGASCGGGIDDSILDMYIQNEIIDETSQKVSQFINWYSSLNSYRRQEFFAHLFADMLTAAPFNFALNGIVSNAFKMVPLSELKILPRHGGLSGAAYLALRKASKDFTNNPFFAECFLNTSNYCKDLFKRQLKFADIPDMPRLTMPDQLLKMSSDIPKQVEKGLSKNPGTIAEAVTTEAPVVTESAAQQVATQTEKIAEKAVEQKPVVLAETLTQEQLKNPTTIPGNIIVKEFTQEVIEEAVKYATTENKITHIFKKPMHNLKPLIDKLGGNENLARAVIHELQGKVFYNEIFKDLKITIGEFEVYIRGSMINGIPFIGTFFIK